MTTTTYMNPEAYFATRRKDYHDLLADISESKGQLGYCEISGNTLTIKVKSTVLPQMPKRKCRYCEDFGKQSAE